MGQKSRKKKKKLSKEEKQKIRIEKKFKVDINTIFSNASFIQIPTRDINLLLNGKTIEVDNVFLYQNLLVISEDTTGKGDSIRDHLNKTSNIFKYITDNKEDFLKLLENKFSKFKKSKSSEYSIDDLKVIFIYCSLNKFDEEYKKTHRNILFLDYNNLQYFLRLSKTINKSIRFELFKFLGLKLADIGISKPGTGVMEYEGFLLPESPSGYPKGYKIVSFLIEPEILLKQSYVLRKDSWRDNDYLYQRLLIPNKINSMREYLISQKRVFVNNIIVTLPEETKLFDQNRKQIVASDIKRKQNVCIQIPTELNTIGIIDGQHRVFSYHEGIDKLDKSIEPLRKKQHLLLTGIIYPNNVDEYKKIKFEAQLFLEINDKQSRTKADLKQAIQVLIEPFSTIAISKSILNNLSKTGPLSTYLEEYFYDTKKIKTSSIVSYGLVHIVKLSGEDSFFSIWKNPNKDNLLNKTDVKLLELYVEYCTSKMKDFLAAFRKTIDPELWTLDKKKSRVLTTTTINGLIYCLRKLILEKKLEDLAYYEKHLKNININFTPTGFEYKSSHWKDLGDKIYSDCFK